MQILFTVAIIAVVGGAVWALTRKKAPSTPVVGGGSSPRTEESKGSINEA
jgi:hypothetical protein